MKHPMTYAAILIAIAVLVVDVGWASGFAAPILYTLSVVAACRVRQSWLTLTAAISCSALTAIGLLAEALGGRYSSVALANDVVALLAIWAVAFYCSRESLDDSKWSSEAGDSDPLRSDHGNTERTISSLLNLTAEGIYGIDLEGRCTFANATCAKLLGYDSPDEFIGHNMHQMIHHSQADGVSYPVEQCRIYKTMRDRTVAHADSEYFWKKDGSSFVSEYWCYPVLHAGECTGAVITFFDISERLQLQDAQRDIRKELEKDAAQQAAELLQTQNRLDYALRGANVGLWDWNAQTNEVFYSETARTQLGYPPDDPWKDFNDWESRLHPDDHGPAVAIVEKYFAERPKEYKSTFRLRCKDGSYRWILSLGGGTFNEEGLPLRLIGVHVDITERVESENELRRLNELLADANEALRQSNVDLQQFAYVASHDLQTPLRAMSGYANLLQADYGSELDDAAVRYLDRIVYGAERMKQLINDLLSYSRIESRARPFETVDLNACLEDAIGMLDADIAASNATITHDELPMLIGDASQLTQLLLNLIGNSIKYRTDDPPKIHIGSSSVNDQWTIKVRDNGIGIDVRHSERIFEIFKRLHTQDEIPGTGIGLAVCRRIVNRHSGSIWFESQAGEGSEFLFTIPVSQLDATPKNSR